MTGYYEAWSADGFTAAIGQCVLSLRHMRMSNTAIMNECGRIWKKSTMTYFEDCSYIHVETETSFTFVCGRGSCSCLVKISKSEALKNCGICLVFSVFTWTLGLT
jgi:hypothetical protein